MSELRDVIQSTHCSFLVNKLNSNLKIGKTLADGQAKPPVQAQTQMAEAPWSSSLRRSKQVNRGPLKTQIECQNQILMKMEGANSAHLSTANKKYKILNTSSVKVREGMQEKHEADCEANA